MKKALCITCIFMLNILMVSCSMMKNTTAETNEPKVVFTKIQESNEKAADDSENGYIINMIIDNREQEGRKIYVENKETINNKDELNLNLNIPVVRGLSNYEVQKKINKNIQDEIEFFISELETISSEWKRGADELEMKLEPYYGGTQYKVTYNKNNILCILITFERYTGGAHGNWENKAFVFDLETGNTAMLSDFFSEIEDYNNIILEEIKRQVNEEPEKYYVDIINQIKEFSFDQDFYIDEDGIVIYFGLYEIAPFVAGISEFKIQNSLFEKGIKQKISIPKPYAVVRNKVSTENFGDIPFFSNKPIVYNLQDTKFQEDINKKIEKQINMFKNEIIKYKESHENFISTFVDYDFIYNNKDEFGIKLKFAIHDNNKAIKVQTIEFKINTNEKIINLNIN